MGRLIIIFGSLFLLQNCFAEVKYKLDNEKCLMTEQGQIMRKVDLSYCSDTGEMKSGFTSLDNSPRDSGKESTGRSPSLEVFYRRKQSLQ